MEEQGWERGMPAGWGPAAVGYAVAGMAMAVARERFGSAEPVGGRLPFRVNGQRAQARSTV
ncbi:hypothetical protein GCM10010331_18000 [Streptomyces xanthochromogenes]|nr:hypothetical protein GCM10010331_18000 [Streptomyces xanthochromogenes]